MAQCLVLCLYLHEGSAVMAQQVLPPMTLPQSLLPDGARFAGVGSYGEDDAYLYVVKGRPAMKTSLACGDAGALDCLITLAKKDVPQDFVLTHTDGIWALTTKDLDQDVF